MAFLCEAEQVFGADRCPVRGYFPPSGNLSRSDAGMRFEVHEFSEYGYDIVRERFPLKDQNGVDLYFESFRLDDGLEKRPLLMVHGLTYASHEFDVDCGDYSLVRYFASRGYEVWLFDVAGYGRSQEIEDGFATTSDYAAENAAIAAERILALRGFDKLDLFGWSWGGLTAGKLAISRPDLIRRLVLYAPLTFGMKDKRVELPFISNTWAHAADDFQVTESGEIDSDITEPEVADLYVSDCRRFDRDTSPNGGRREIFISPEKRILAAELINMPTLVISGTHDQYCSVESSRSTYALLPNKDSKLIIVEGASHMMMIEKPFYRAFRKTVADFLDGNR